MNIEMKARIEIPLHLEDCPVILQAERVIDGLEKAIDIMVQVIEKPELFWMGYSNHLEHVCAIYGIAMPSVASDFEKVRSELIEVYNTEIGWFNLNVKDRTESLDPLWCLDH